MVFAVAGLLIAGTMFLIWLLVYHIIPYYLRSSKIVRFFIGFGIAIYMIAMFGIFIWYFSRMIGFSTFLRDLFSPFLAV